MTRATPRLARLALILIALVWSWPARSSVISLALPPVAPGSSGFAGNFVENGFILSPNCSFVAGGMTCDNGGVRNANYIGPPLTPDLFRFQADLLYITGQKGQDFDLQSVDLCSMVSADGRCNVGNPIEKILSSNGGQWVRDRTQPYPTEIALGGPQWDDLDWVLLLAGEAGSTFFADRVILDVDEPETLALFTAGLLWLALACRRRLRRIGRAPLTNDKDRRSGPKSLFFMASPTGFEPVLPP